MQEAATSRSTGHHWIWSAGFALALAAVSLLVVQAYRSAQRAEAMREFLAHTSHVLGGVQQLETLATRIEADQRGFLISGTPDLQRSRDAGFAQATRAIAELRSLLQGDTGQLQRLDDVANALQLRQARMKVATDLVDSRGLAAGRASFEQGSAESFEQVRSRLAVLRDAQQRNLERFSAEAGSSARHFNDLLALGAVVAVALLVVSGGMLWRQVRRSEALRSALARSDAFQRAVLRNAGMMVIAVDPDGLITVFNQAAKDALGYEPSELVGHHDPGLFHLDSEIQARAEQLTRELGAPVAPGFEVFVAKARRGITDVGRWTYVHRDGSHLRVQLAVSAVRDSDGVLLGFVGIAQDVTEHELAHEQLRLSESRTRAIIETASEAFIAIDDDGIIEDWNAQAERILGWSRHEALGRRLSELVIPERFRSAHQRGLQRYLADGHGPVMNRRIEISAVDRSDREFPIELTIWPIEAGSRTSFNAFLQDITERKAAQDAIRTLNAELTAQAEQLAQSNRELEGFSYSVSHDLRAPLRHISGYAQILREEAEGQLGDSLLRYLDEISASARRMGALIDDLLALSRFSRQALTPVRVDMNAVVAEAIADAGLVQNPQASIDIAELPAAHGDPVLLRQVWVNLLSNAVKYSAPRGAAAQIRVEGERDRGHVRYRVRDNGVGFDTRYADKLFGVFQRLHAQDEFEGTGVGLAIVQRIVARHRGQVSAHSEPGRGAEFTFELPTPSENEVNA
ncbi:MAG TPA: PAS domain S-box protein [Lysobacter sp.]|nr:PAS domain S-box protein [Lysobacter sp.]